MSREHKIAFILKSRNSATVYSDLRTLPEQELDALLRHVVGRMRNNESAVIARMNLTRPTFSLN
jgi:hypothetical protein